MDKNKPEKVYYKVKCGSCGSDVIVSVLPDGVLRLLCTGCRGLSYATSYPSYLKNPDTGQRHT